MSALPVWLPRVNLWHFVWIAVLLSVLLSLLLSALIHRQILWQYPFGATLIALTVASVLLYVITQMLDLKQTLSEALRESQERFSSAFRDAAIGMALVGTDGHWLQVNPALCELVGYTEQELLATSFQAITHPDDLDADLAFVRQMLAGEIRTYQMEKRYLHKQGHVIWILLSVSLVRDGFNRPLYFIGQIQDITERKRVEDELGESKARLQAILDHSPTMVFLKDTDGRYLLVNRQFEAAFHLLAKDIAGKTDDEIFPPEQAATFRANDRKVFQAGVAFQFEEVALHDDGPHTSIVFKFPLCTKDGRPYALCGITTDITERKRVEDELLALKDDLATDLMAMGRLHEFSTRLVASTELQPLLEEVLTATIALQDADFGNVQLYNPHTQALEIVAHRGFQQEFLEYFSSVHDGSAACGRALQQQERVIIEDVQTDPRFEPHRPIAASAGFRAVQSTPLFSRSGESLGMISTHFRQAHRPSERDLRLTDLYARQAAEMIERKRGEEALRESEQRLRQALEERERLSLDLHDTVIQSIYAIGMSLESCHYLIEKDPGLAAQRLRSSITDLNGVMKEVRNYIEWASPTITRSDQFQEAFEQLVRTIPSACPLAMRLEIDPSAVGQLTADEAMHVLQITREAISNSLRHSGAKTGEVALCRTEGGLRLEVHDDGRGFDTTSGAEHGLGLRNMAARAGKLKADLTVLSEPGHGTRIILNIPKKHDHA